MIFTLFIYFLFLPELLRLQVVFHNILLFVVLEFYILLLAYYFQNLFSFNLFSSFRNLNFVIFKDLLVSIVKCFNLYLVISHQTVGLSYHSI